MTFLFRIRILETLRRKSVTDFSHQHPLLTSVTEIRHQHRCIEHHFKYSKGKILLFTWLTIERKRIVWKFPWSSQVRFKNFNFSVNFLFSYFYKNNNKLQKFLSSLENRRSKNWNWCGAFISGKLSKNWSSCPKAGFQIGVYRS